MSSYIQVHLFDVPYHVDMAYTYFVPDALERDAVPGAFVVVPFGRNNRRTAGIVTGFSGSGSFENAKPVFAVCDRRFTLDESALRLCSFMKDTCLCTIGDAAKCMVPSAVFSSVDKSFEVTGLDPSQISGAERDVYEYVSIMGRASLKDITRSFGDGAQDTAFSLCRKGLLSYETSMISPASEIFVSRYYLVSSPEKSLEACSKLRGEKQKAVLSAVCAENGIEKKDLMRRTGCTSAQLSALIEKGLLREERYERLRDPYYARTADSGKKNILSDLQRKAFLELKEMFKSGKPSAALLFGVTGSGKTRVVKAMMDEVIASGRTVIMLVPEISLTPQTVSVFSSFYGNRVTVIHSSLSQGEKLDSFKRILAGEADIVIGTRSAVFAPLKNIGMIVLDEEQELTYKSDINPKYHARDIARFRCAENNALMLLCSATPSVESFRKAETGRYRLIKLGERYGGAKLPEVEVADMRDELRSGNVSPFSRLLLGEMEKLGKKGEQGIILLNRRGYNTFQYCMSCGSTVLCPNCSIPLTRHREHGENEGRMLCHYCGYTCTLPKTCPVCGSDKLSFNGCGTQRAESEIGRLLPESRTLRMDADTTTAKESYYRMLDDFRSMRYDLLLGTQMVAKGHDFPKVTLVGVLSADASLSVGDYRAAEHTFSLITQVVGRAGRSGLDGKAVIQTFKPDNESLRLACRGDYEEFYRAEIKYRESYVWPPFCDVVKLTLSASDEKELSEASSRLADIFFGLAKQEYSDVKIIAFGPFPSPVYKQAGRFRHRMIIKCRLNARTRKFFSEIMTRFGEGEKHGIQLAADFNPSSI